MKTLKTTALKQSGAVLPVAMVMLLISTMVGLASIRSTTGQAKMSANMYSRSLAYQAAEAALDAAQDAIASSTVKQTLGANCLSAYDILMLRTNENTDTTPCPAIPETTFQSTNSDWTGVTLSFATETEKKAFLTEGLAPQYYIERIGLTNFGSTDADHHQTSNSGNSYNYGEYVSGGASQRLIYRITARSGVPSRESNRSIVALQATFEQNL